MADDKQRKEQPNPDLKDISVVGPRLTPHGHASGKATGGDATNPSGEGAKQGQRDKAEG